MFLYVTVKLADLVAVVQSTSARLDVKNPILIDLPGVRSILEA